MRKLTFFLIGIIVLLLIPICAFSQIISTWPATPPEKTVTVDVDTSVNLSATGMNLTLSGANRNWTFNHQLDAFNGIDILTTSPSGDRNEGDFTTAEWIQKFGQFFPEIKLEVTSTFTINIPAELAQVTQYQRISNGSIVELGSDIIYSLLNEGKGGPFIYPEPAMVYPNPMTDDSPPWIEKRFIESNLTVPFGTSSFKIPGSLTDSSNVEVDGWGTLNLNGTSYPCLRLKYHEYRIIHTEKSGFIPSFDATFASITYSWINEDFEVLLELSSDADSGENFAVADLVIAKQPGAPDAVDCDPCRTENTPEQFVLEQNYPNPFNPTTQFQYSLAQPAEVRITIFNILGHPVASINEGFKTVGTYQIQWDAVDDNGIKLSNGIYFYQMAASALDGSVYTQNRKMILSK